MSILGYSSSYFLPEYWAKTPLYGEKIIPLLDYILSADYTEADKLANAFYNLQNKYKDTANLPIDQIEAIIDESGYTYVKELLGQDEESIRLLINLLVLIHQLKGTATGIEVVLNLLKRGDKGLVMGVIGTPKISANNILSNITSKDYVLFSNFSTGKDPFELKFQFRTGPNFQTEQCIASIGDMRMYLGINIGAHIVFSAGNNGTSWSIVTRRTIGNVTLSPNTQYFLKVIYDGNEYTLHLSEDDKRYSALTTVKNSNPLNLEKGVLFIGVNGSTSDFTYPFSGSINLGTVYAKVEDIELQQWFETFPIKEGSEDTFNVKASLDLNIVNSDFFKNFYHFVSKYVYPSLGSFEAKVSLENRVTFIPYVRQRITYIAASLVDGYEIFDVKKSQNEDVWEDFYTMVNQDVPQEGSEGFYVRKRD